MNSTDVKLMIEEGEGFELEFKRKVSSPEKIARTLCAFSNTRGGSILFGVDDDGSVVGVESEKSEIELIELAGNYYCDPPAEIGIEIIPFNARDVIVVSVEESAGKPHKVKAHDAEGEKVFIRVNDKTVAASKEVVKVLRDERPESPPLMLSIGEREKFLFSYLEKNERITVQEFSDMINVSKRRASRIMTTLVRAGVLRIHTLEKQDYFTFASDDPLPPTASGQNHKVQFRKQPRH